MLGNIASIVTLALFLVYIIGRIVTIYKVKSIVADRLTICNPKENKGDFNIVDEITIGEYPINTLLITSQNGIYSFVVYKVEYDKNYKKIVARESVYMLPYLNIEQTLQINVKLEETVNKFEISYLTSDYRRITIPLYLNMKNGIVSELAQPKHTLKSILYYLFQ